MWNTLLGLSTNAGKLLCEQEISLSQPAAGGGSMRILFVGRHPSGTKFACNAARAAMLLGSILQAYSGLDGSISGFLAVSLELQTGV